MSGKGARPCKCAVEQMRQRRLAKIPAEFEGMDLASLTPQRHNGQADVIEAFRSRPTDNYFLAGGFGSGKTMLMWLLYRYLVETGRTTPFVFTLIELLDDYKASFNSGSIPTLTADHLRTTNKYTVFLDDIDKARPTEYAAEQLFNLVDAIYAYKHQLVVTTNLRAIDLKDHFDKADERYGGAIVRRILNNTTRFEMF